MINIPYSYNLKKEEFSGIIYETKKNYFLFFSEGKRYYIFLKNHTYEVGDIIHINGRIGNIYDTSLEGEFSFKDYLYNRKIEYRIYINDVNYFFQNPIKLNYFKNKILSTYDEYGQYFIGNIFLNYNDNSFDDILNTYQLNYLFTFSSIYFYFFYKIIFLLFKNLFRVNKNTELISLIVMAPIIIISNYRLSLIKTFVLLYNKEVLKEKYRKIDIASVILLIVIISNYRYISTSSFYYIFVSFFVSIFLSKSLKGYKTIKRKIINTIFYSLLFSLISIVFDNKFSLINFIYLPFLVIVFQTLLIFGFGSLFVYSFKPILNKLIYYLMFSLRVFEKYLPVLYFNDNKYFVVLVIFILLILFSYFSEIRIIKVSKVILASIYSALIFFASPFDAYNSSYINFINVGQGDAIHIHFKKTDILIDTGGSIYKDIATDVLIPYFKRNHISNLDAVFITHEDYDHNGAFKSLNENFSIYDTIIGSTFETKNINGLVLKNLNHYNIGISENDQSSVIYMSFKNLNFLLMGDAGIDIENKIIEEYNLKVDILKIGHHGSNTSSGYNFLKHINPDEAVISVGVNNMYNHPNDDVINNLKKLNIKIRRTDIEGSIKY